MTNLSGKLWTKGYILLGLSILFLSIAFYLLMPTLPVYAQDVLGANNSQLGLIVAIYTLAALIIRPFAGIAVDLHGRRWILLASAWLFTFLFLGYSWATLFIPLLFLRFLHGLQWGVATSAYFTAAVDLIPVNKRGRGIGYFGLAFNIAMAIGPAAGLLIMGTDRYGWLFNSAFVLSIIGAGLLFFVNYPKFERHESLRFTWKGIIAKKSLHVTFNTLLISSTFGGIVTFLAIFARENHLEQYTGLYFTLMAIGMGFARIFSGQIFDRFGPRIITMVGLGLAILGFWLLAGMPGCSCFLISSVIIGSGIGIVVPSFQTMANNVVVKARRGVANSTFLTGLDLGIGLGSLYVGWIADLFSLSAAFKVSAIILAFAFIYFLIKTLPHYNLSKVVE